MTDWGQVGPWRDAEFLGAAFRGLDEQGVNFCIERNDEGYPDEITGDIDLVVNASQIGPAVASLIATGEAFGWRPFVRYLSSQAAHVGFFADRFPDRFALVFECFAGGVWRGVCFLPAERILERRRPAACGWAAHPVHAGLITLIHHLLYNRRVYPKYRERLGKVARDDGDFLQAELALGFGESLAREIVERVWNRDWNDLEQRAGALRRSLCLRSSLHRPWDTLSGFWKASWESRRKPEGVAISLEGLDRAVVGSLAEALIAEADRLHLFIPPNRRLLSDSEAHPTVVQRIVRSGGVAVVVNPEGVPMPAGDSGRPAVRVLGLPAGDFRVVIGERSETVAAAGAVPGVWKWILHQRSREDRSPSDS